MDPELLSILVCPETRAPVRPAGPELLEVVNKSIEGGQLENRGGSLVSEVLTEALVREDGAVLYPVRDGIPVMLIDESVDVSSFT